MPARAQKSTASKSCSKVCPETHRQPPPPPRFNRVPDSPADATRSTYVARAMRDPYPAAFGVAGTSIVPCTPTSRKMPGYRCYQLEGRETIYHLSWPAYHSRESVNEHLSSHRPDVLPLRSVTNRDSCLLSAVALASAVHAGCCRAARDCTMAVNTRELNLNSTRSANASILSRTP